MNTSVKKLIEDAFPGRVVEPASAEMIPRGGVYLVYVFVCDGKAVVVGHGKYNRAKVIFDDREHITAGHIKAIFVRAYHLFGGTSFERYFIQCDNKNEAEDVEKHLHHIIGGNIRVLPEKIETKIFGGISSGSQEELVLRIALNSSFDGLNDLKVWRKKNLLSDEVWSVIATKFQLDDPAKI